MKIIQCFSLSPPPRTTTKFVFKFLSLHGNFVLGETGDGKKVCGSRGLYYRSVNYGLNHLSENALCARHHTPSGFARAKKKWWWRWEEEIAHTETTRHERPYKVYYLNFVVCKLFETKNSFLI
jgi:hypothetical protein